MITISNFISATASPEVIAALIALAGVLVSVLITLLLGLATRKYNYHQLFAETVSQSRNTWLNEMRDFISTLIAEARILQIKNTDDEEYIVHFKSYYKTREQIELRLNLQEINHTALKQNLIELDKLIESPDNKKLNLIINNIEEIAQKILKEEWEKVKIEAKGKGEKQLWK